MILEPIIQFLKAILGETLVADPLIGGSMQLIAVVLVVLFSAVIIMLPFALIVKILRWRKKKKC